MLWCPAVIKKVDSDLETRTGFSQWGSTWVICIFSNLLIRSKHLALSVWNKTRKWFLDTASRCRSVKTFKCKNGGTDKGELVIFSISRCNDKNQTTSPYQRNAHTPSDTVRHQEYTYRINHSTIFTKTRINNQHYDEVILMTVKIVKIRIAKISLRI